MELLEQRPPEEAVRPPEAEPEASPSVPETEPQAAPEDRPESPLLLPEGEESPAPLPEQPPQAPRQRRSIRPEWIMGLIAILAAALLLVMVVL